MTVQELIDKLRALPEECRGMDVLLDDTIPEYKNCRYPISGISIENNYYPTDFKVVVIG